MERAVRKPYSYPQLANDPPKAASHCPEIDRRWTYEYVILNFMRRWPSNHHLAFGESFWHAKDLATDREVEAGVSKIEPMASGMPLGMPRSLYDYSQM